jgi:hypothetical protein
MTDQKTPKSHRLKNGAPAHVLTLEDRREAAAVTNEIRRAKRELFEQERLNRELDAWLARREAAWNWSTSRCSAAWNWSTSRCSTSR